jgi:hypothetical protein
VFVASVIVSVVLAILAAASAHAVLTRNTKVITQMTRLGIPMNWLPFLAGCEIAGSVGLLAGIAYPPLGIAAAGGLILYFVGAVLAHLRVGDKDVAPALVFLAVSVAALVLRVASM